MPVVVGITLRRSCKVYYFSPGRLTDLQLGEYVIVDTSRGQAMGRLASVAREIPPSDIKGDLKPVVRRANAWDAVQQDLYERQEPAALDRTRGMVAEQGMPMKVIDVEYNFDGTHLTVYFSAESRVDFRALVRELSKSFRSAVEMRQVGVRDEAKLLDGCGRCGRRLCCAAWMQDFQPVSIRLAKQQDLPLNPAEISGACGRLLCCLCYETEVYAEALNRLPPRRTKVMTQHGEGTVQKVHPLKDSVTVQIFGAESTVEVPADELVVDEVDQKKIEQQRSKRRKRGHAQRRK